MLDRLACSCDGSRRDLLVYLVATLLVRLSTVLARCPDPFGDRKVVEDPEYSSEMDSESVVEGVSPVSPGIG